MRITLRLGGEKKEEEKILMMRPVLKYDACTMGLGIPVTPERVNK